MRARRVVQWMLVAGLAWQLLLGLRFACPCRWARDEMKLNGGVLQLSVDCMQRVSPPGSCCAGRFFIHDTHAPLRVPLETTAHVPLRPGVGSLPDLAICQVRSGVPPVLPRPDLIALHILRR